MRKFGILAVLALMALAIAAVPALGARQGATGNAHFQSGPDFVINDDNSVTVTGLVVGLGSDAVDVTLTTEATGDVSCTNRGRQLVEAQQDLADVSTTLEDQFPDNGRLVIDITTDAPSELIGNPCPNRNWTPDLIESSVVITGAELTLVQNGEEVAGTPITM